MKKPIVRKVVVVFGKWGKNTDFVLEPVCSGECNCDICKDAIYITRVKEKD